MIEKVKIKAIIDKTIKKIDCENHYDNNVFECGYYFCSDDKYVDYYEYLALTTDKRVVKFNTYNKCIRKNDVIIGNGEEINDDVLGKVLVIDNAKIKADDETKYLRFIKDNFDEIDGDIINKIYNKYHTSTLEALQSLDILLKYNIKEADIYKIAKRARILDEFNYYFTTLNVCAGIQLSFRAISRMIMDGITNAELEDNPYVILKYTENTDDLKKLDEYYLITNKKSRNVYLIYLFLLNEYREHGNICFKLDDIEEIQKAIDNIDDVKTEKSEIIEAINNHEFYIFNNCVYIYKNYFIEKDLCNKIIDRLNGNVEDKKANLKYMTDEQNKALNNVLNNKLSVVNGGPGTGKSYLISNIIRYITENEKDKKVLVISLTGRVVNKLKDSIPYSPNVRFHTIHGALNLNVFQKNNVLNNIDDDYVLIDECSMIDINLFKYLFTHINRNSHIALFGDYNQLQAIGAGNVFYDLCQSNISKTTLTKIFRVLGDNSIISNSQKVLNGAKIDELNTDNNFYIINNINSNYINDISADCISCFLNQRNIDIEDVMILTATKERARKMNDLVQRKFNKSKDYVIIKDRIFKLHDKVMNVKNNKELDIMNGDIGYVHRIDADSNYITVKYKNIDVIYDGSNIGNLELAYSMTVHKAQGSEAKNVFIILGKNEEKMMNRNLIYTAITRAKNNVVIIGETEVIDNAIGRFEEKALSNITYRIKER